MTEEELQERIGIAYKKGREDGYRECEKTAMHVLAAITLRQGGEVRISDFDIANPPAWTVERWRDEEELCTVFRVFERKD